VVSALTISAIHIASCIEVGCPHQSADAAQPAAPLTGISKLVGEARRRPGPQIRTPFALSAHPNTGSPFGRLAVGHASEPRLAQRTASNSVRPSDEPQTRTTQTPAIACDRNLPPCQIQSATSLLHKAQNISVFSKFSQLTQPQNLTLRQIESFVHYRSDSQKPSGIILAVSRGGGSSRALFDNSYARPDFREGEAPAEPRVGRVIEWASAIPEALTSLSM
jgi:hypothetical protein